MLTSVTARQLLRLSTCRPSVVTALRMSSSDPSRILMPADKSKVRLSGTIQVVKDELGQKVVGGPCGWNPLLFFEERKGLMNQIPSSASELPPRRMLDSYDEVVIPLSTDAVLRDRYTNLFGNVRMGRLLEDMDIFAAHIVFRHMLNPRQPAGSERSPFSIVTALVDRIDVKGDISVDSDIRMMGHVTWVGKSSVEATLELFQERNGGHWQHVTEGTFVMVVRDPMNQGNSFANQLELETEEEKALFARGERNKVERLGVATESLFKNPPSEEEKRIIHDFFIRTVDHKALSFKARVKPPNSVWMEDAKLKNIIICQPENRNRFHKIFGGFIMRQAFELAFASAYVYSQRRPIILHMDDILFRKPVDVGALLYFNSQMSFTEKNMMQVRVSAEVLNPATAELSLSNVFQYTFAVNGEDVNHIIPKTYHEAMMYLEGRRHFTKCTKG